MNRVCLIGRLTRDPDLRYTTSGLAVVRFTLAVDRRMSKEKKQEAEAKNQPTADFINCTAWGKTADAIANYVKKGQRLAIEGNIQTGSYEKNKQKIYITEVNVLNCEFLEKSEGGFNNPQENDGFCQINDDDIPF